MRRHARLSVLEASTRHPRPLVPNVGVERIADASHWVQADAPERVNQMMVDFLLEPIGG
jgi:pimeloyl-ACP methyl ester carboxylesterase